MSHGSGGSPVNFLDPDTCDDILQGLGREEGTLPNFDSDPDTPPPALEAEVACNRGTQTCPTPTQDQSTYVLMVRTQNIIRTVSHQSVQALPPQLVAEGCTQTTQTWTRKKATQVQQVATRDGITSTPHVPTCDRGTEMPHRTTNDTSIQMPRAILKDRGTCTTTVTFKRVTSQTKVYFDNSEIPPGAPRPTLPWWYEYQQFDSLLAAYSEVHPEDFVTFGILQEQLRRGTIRDRGEVATVLAHMIGGRRTLVNELVIIANRIQRLDRHDPMRVVEEQALVDVLLRERCRSAVPLGEASFPQLEAPGGPLGRPANPGPTGAPRDPRRHPPPSAASESQPGPSGAQGGPQRSALTLPGPSGTQGGRPEDQRLPPGPSGALRAQGGPHRPPPGFPEMVDLTADADTEEEEMDEAPVTPSPNVSDDGSTMHTDEEEDILAYHGLDRDGAASSSDDGFEHI